jgi:hypothetical protein
MVFDLIRVLQDGRILVNANDKKSSVGFSKKKSSVARLHD